jgi:chemotaxis protein methyltransferase CheR
VRSLFKEIIEEKKEEHDPFFHIWSAGCANGEEPYSLAILLKEVTGETSFRCHTEITATDVDEKCMAFAQKGMYTRQSIKNVDRGFLERYFSSRGQEYQIIDEIKSLVKFQYLDLTSPEYVKNADVVFCRNVFIYFDRSLQEQLLMKFYNALKPRGYLIMGKSETLISEAKHIFDEISFDARLYRKKAKL